MFNTRHVPQFESAPALLRYTGEIREEKSTSRLSIQMDRLPRASPENLIDCEHRW